MSAQQANTDSKLDQQTGLLRWILAGVGGSIVAVGAWIGTQFVQDKSFLRDDVRGSLKEISTATTNLAKSQEKAIADQNANQVVTNANQSAVVKILEQMRDDQRKFPAVAEKMQ